MTTQYSGVVADVRERDWKNGIFLYHFTLEGSARVHNCGTTNPELTPGETIRFAVLNSLVDSKSIVRGPLNATSSPTMGEAEVDRGSPSGDVSTKKAMPVTVSRNDRDNYWQQKEARDLARMPIIDRREARHDAVRLVIAAMQAELLPIPKSTKPADKWERLLDLINETTTDLLEQENEQNTSSTDA